MKLLLTADWHTRSDNPICRIDDFQKIQRDTLEQINTIAAKNEAAIVIAGDIFQRAKPDKAQELEIMLYDIFKDNLVYFIAGQHDLLYHKLGNFYKGSIGVLKGYDNWYTNFNNFIYLKNGSCLTPFHFGEGIWTGGKETQKSIAILHRYVAEKQLPFFIKDGITAKELLDNCSYTSFITGDNHHGFIYEKNNRFVINPGCITRQTADMKNYKPFVVLFDAWTKEYEKIFLLDNDPNVIDTSHLDSIKARDNRIDHFVEKLKGQVNLELSFEENIKKYLRENNINGNIKEKVLKAIGEKK